MNRKQMFGGYAMEINVLNQQISDLNISTVLMNEDKEKKEESNQDDDFQNVKWFDQ